MARNPKPLNILIDDDILRWDGVLDYFDELSRKGHSVYKFSDLDSDVIPLSHMDLILSPQVWRVYPGVTKGGFDSMIKAARNMKYSKGK